VKFPSADVDYVEVQLYRRDVREEIARWEPLTQVRSRADGEFRFAELRAGEYKVRCSRKKQWSVTRWRPFPNGPAYGFPRDFLRPHVISLRPTRFN
jgi:hypothetical protein